MQSFKGGKFVKSFICPACPPSHPLCFPTLGVLRQPEQAIARLPRRVLGVLKQQGSDVLELGAQIWGGKNL